MPRAATTKKKKSNARTCRHANLLKGPANKKAIVEPPSLQHSQTRSSDSGDDDIDDYVCNNSGDELEIKYNEREWWRWELL